MRSSFFNTEVTKLLSIYIKDVRVNRNIQNDDGQGGRRHMQNSTSSANVTNDNSKAKGVPDFRHAKVPPSILTFAQFMAVHINNLSVVLKIMDFNPDCYLLIIVKELHLNGSIVHNAKTLLVSAAINDAQVYLISIKEIHLFQTSRLIHFFHFCHSSQRCCVAVR